MPEVNSEEIDAIHARMRAAEQCIDRMKEAFPQNSLKLPDYDGHRVAHEQAVEAAKVVDKYKFSATSQVISVVIAALLGLVASGFVAKLGGLFK